jgi:hypothetical protein
MITEGPGWNGREEELRAVAATVDQRPQNINPPSPNPLSPSNPPRRRNRHC